ncbi:hypothetical protein Vafri_20350, partial [Volvox africanus]
MDEETRSTLLRVVTAIIQREEAQKYFNEPLNSAEHSGYAICVQRPMDLDTIRRNLQLMPGESPYSSAAAVLQDVQLVWDNCAAYFPPGHEARVAADSLSGAFTQMYQAAQQQQQQLRMQSFQQQQQQFQLQKQQSHFALQHNPHNPQQQQQAALGHPPPHPMQTPRQPFQHTPQPPQTFMFVPVDNAPPSQLGGHQPPPAPAAVSAPPPPPSPQPPSGGGGAAATGTSAAHPGAAAMAPG